MAIGQNFHSANVVQGQPLGMISAQVLLTADNAVIDPTGYSLILVGSDNTTAANRTFTLLASGLVGHTLVLTLTSAGATTCQLADSGSVKLSAAWEPLQFDTLTLVSDGTFWLEACRSDN